MNHFKVNQEKIELIKRQVWIRMLLIIVLGIGIEMVIKYFHDDNLIIMPILATAIGVSILHFVKTKKQIKIFESFLLTISDTSIIRELKNAPAIEIAFKDINQIIRTNDGSFKIKGSTPNDIIFIPSYIENYGSMEKLLYKIGPITNNKYNPLPIMLGLVMLFPISLFIFASVLNKILIAISGFIIIFILILFIIKVQKNKNIDKGTRRSKYLAILFAIFILIITLSRISK